MHSFRLFPLAALLLVVTADLRSQGAAPPFTFEVILKNGDAVEGKTIKNVLGVCAINDNGEVVVNVNFGVPPKDDGIVVVSKGKARLLAYDGKPISDGHTLSQRLACGPEQVGFNNKGQALFPALVRDARGPGGTAYVLDERLLLRTDNQQFRANRQWAGCTRPLLTESGRALLGCGEPKALAIPDLQEVATPAGHLAYVRPGSDEILRTNGCTDTTSLAIRSGALTGPLFRQARERAVTSVTVDGKPVDVAGVAAVYRAPNCDVALAEVMSTTAGGTGMVRPGRFVVWTTKGKLVDAPMQVDVRRLSSYRQAGDYQISLGGLSNITSMGGYAVNGKGQIAFNAASRMSPPPKVQLLQVIMVATPRP